MRNLVKITCVVVAVLAFAGCRKTEFDSVMPGNVTADKHTKLYHDDADDNSGDGGSLFTDKDKCKKCHGGPVSGKSIGIDWKAPYMSNGEYSSIEELINNFDFVNYVHMKKADAAMATKSNVQPGITPQQKQQLIDYLKSLASAANANVPETK